MVFEFMLHFSICVRLIAFFLQLICVSPSAHSLGVRFIETLDLSDTKIRSFAPLLVGMSSKSLFFLLFFSSFEGYVEMPSLKRLILRNCSQLTVIRLNSPECHHLDITRCYLLEELTCRSREVSFLPLDDSFSKLRKLDCFLPPPAFVTALRLSLLLLQPPNATQTNNSTTSGSELTVAGTCAKTFRAALVALQEFCTMNNQWQPTTAENSKKKTIVPLQTLTILRV
jgi:hypothetical protein